MTDADVEKLEQEFAEATATLNKSPPEGLGPPEPYKKPRKCLQSSEELEQPQAQSELWKLCREISELLKPQVDAGSGTAARLLQLLQSPRVAAPATRRGIAPRDRVRLGAESSSISDVLDTLKRRDGVQTCRMPSNEQLTFTQVRYNKLRRTRVRVHTSHVGLHVHVSQVWRDRV